MKESKLINFNPSFCISRKMMTCNRIVANIFRKHIAQFEISDSQLSILFVISKVEEINQKKIAEILVLEKSTVNRNLTRLFTKKLLLQKSSSRIVLTKKGISLLQEVIPHWQNAMKEIREILTIAGEENLDMILHKLSTTK